jgi:hypothetical protein
VESIGLEIENSIIKVKRITIKDDDTGINIER